MTVTTRTRLAILFFTTTTTRNKCTPSDRPSPRPLLYSKVNPPNCRHKRMHCCSIYNAKQLLRRRPFRPFGSAWQELPELENPHWWKLWANICYPFPFLLHHPTTTTTNKTTRLLRRRLLLLLSGSFLIDSASSAWIPAVWYTEARFWATRHACRRSRPHTSAST